VAYAVVGPSRILVLGPDSALAPLIAAAVLPLSGGDAETAVILAGMLAILTGVLELARLKKLVRPARDVTLWSLLLDVMALDTQKHIAMLRFLDKHPGR
jgi:hypothetical protein